MTGDERRLLSASRALVISTGCLAPMPMGFDTDTVTAQTPSGGQHYFYKLPADIDPTTVKSGSDKLGSGIDHRSYNSLVVGAGTVRSGKGEYKWVRSPAEYEIKEAPRSLVELCRRERTRQEPLVLPGFEIDPPTRWNDFANTPRTTRRKPYKMRAAAIPQYLC
jgi:Bifunctional DNA primase/polymerase, N-terminal